MGYECRTYTNLYSRFVDMNKVIRATITVEVPYENDYMNYGDKLNKKIKQIIADTDFVSCGVEAGNLEPCKEPVLREKV